MIALLSNKEQLSWCVCLLSTLLVIAYCLTAAVSIRMWSTGSCARRCIHPGQLLNIHSDPAVMVSLNNYRVALFSLEFPVVAWVTYGSCVKWLFYNINWLGFSYRMQGHAHPCVCVCVCVCVPFYSFVMFSLGFLWNFGKCFKYFRWMYILFTPWQSIHMSLIVFSGGFICFHIS